MVFPEHVLAHELLDGLRGLEIGAAAHNPFGLQTRNVAPLEDYPFYAAEQAACGVMPASVDIWSDADEIPVDADSEDFVLSSHVVEHLPNLVSTFIEWNRIVRVGGFVFLIAPLPDALPEDRTRSATTLEHLIDDYRSGHTVETHPIEGVPGGRRGHYHVFRPDTIVQLVEWMKRERLCDWELVAREDVDSKVGNGFTLAFRVKSKVIAATRQPERDERSSPAQPRNGTASRERPNGFAVPTIPAAETEFRMALVGTFEVANYGDLLFPAILERLGRRRIPGLTLRLFSPSDGTYSFDRSAVKSVRRLDEEAADLDAIVFGGGDIARFDPASWVPGIESRTGYADLVVLPAAAAVAANVPFAWNAPGVAPGVTERQTRVLAQVLSTACYAAVRDPASAQLLAQVGRDVRVVPDSGFLVADAFPKQDLAAVFAKLRVEFGLAPRFITVHLSPATASPSDFADAADALARLSERHAASIVLLPLGPMHGETQALSRVAARHPERLMCLPGDLHPLEWAAILAHSLTHIGSGLHGCVTTFAYGVPTVVVNSRVLAKLDQFAALTGSPILESWLEVGAAVQAARETVTDTFRREISIRANQHVSDMLDAVQSTQRNANAIQQQVGLAGELIRLSSQPTAARTESAELLRRIASMAAEAADMRIALELRSKMDDELSRLRGVIRIQSETLGQRALNTIRAMRDSLFPEQTVARSVYRGLRTPVDRVSRMPAAIAAAIKTGIRDMRTNRLRRKYRRLVIGLSNQPLVSLLTPVYNVDEKWLLRAVESVRLQAYSNWELCLVNDRSSASHIRPLLDRLAASDSRIRVLHRDRNAGIVAASNDALAMARGEFAGLLDHDDELAPEALYEVVARINQHPDLDLIYSDEDKITEAGTRFDPVLKPGWNPGLLLSCNYITHFSVLRTGLVRAVGGFREQFDGSQDYDLFLRVSEQARRIEHIPKVLYHWRVVESSTASSATAKPYAYTAAVRALREAQSRRGAPGSVEIISPGLYRVRSHVRERSRVTMVVLGCDETANRLLGETDYPAMELRIVAENASVQDLNDAVRSTDCPFAIVLTAPLRPLRADWLMVLVEQMTRSEVALVGARICGLNGQLLHTGCTIDGEGLPVTTADLLPRPSITRTLYADLNRDCLTVGGGCVLIRRSAFDAVGGYDCNFSPALASEALGVRLRRAGWSVVYTPHTVLRETSRAAVRIPDSDAVRFRKLVREEWPDGDPFFTPVRHEESFQTLPRAKAA